MNYEVIRSKRKTMAIQVFRDQRILMRVPLRCKQDDIKVFFEKNLSWIENKLADSRQYPGLPKSQYKDAGSIWLLGESVDISVQKSNFNRLAQEGNLLVVEQRDISNNTTTYRLINQWKRDYAADLFQKRLAYWASQFPTPLKDYQFRLRKMKRQWGNCNCKGVITINSQLVRYPLSCIDYVLAHELTHLKYLHHGRAFYQLLEQVVPDWHQKKLLLSQFSGTAGATL